MDSVATLIKAGGRIYDEALNEKIELIRRDVYVQARSVYRNEFYQAAQAGLKPTINLYISHRVDYEGEMDVEFEGKTYSVIRADWDGDGVNLVCEERINEPDVGSGDQQGAGRICQGR